MSAVPESAQCGWIKDKYGLSWQIAPADLEMMMRSGTEEQRERVTEGIPADEETGSGLRSGKHLKKSSF